MSIVKLISASLLVAVAVGGSACSKNTPEPTGEVEVHFSSLRSGFTQGFPSGTIRYAVYTEAAYSNFQGAAPLYQGQTPITLTTDGKTYQSTTTVSGLNSGNYVFVLGAAFPASVQVTAGRTNTFSYQY